MPKKKTPHRSTLERFFQPNARREEEVVLDQKRNTKSNKPQKNNRQQHRPK